MQMFILNSVPKSCVVDLIPTYVNFFQSSKTLKHFLFTCNRWCRVQH